MLVGVSTALGSERNVPPRATVKVKPCGTCATLTPRTVVLVLLGLDEVSIDRLFAQRPACFEAMQSVYEDEAVTIAQNPDGCLLSHFQHTLCSLLACLLV